MTDPIESIICEALTGQTDRDLAICRIACNAAASRQMFCSCGSVLDQKRVAVATVRVGDKDKVFALCSKCWAKDRERIIDAAKTTGTPVVVETWQGVDFKQGFLD